MSSKNVANPDVRNFQYKHNLTIHGVIAATIRMLAKKNRLTKRTDFSAIYSKGAYVRQGDIMIKYIQTDNPEARIGFSLGKSFSKKAVERNRARRIMQEACRTHIESLKPGANIVVMLNPQVKDVEFENSVQALQQIFKKANLFA